MNLTFDEQFRSDMPDDSKITGLYIDRAKSNSSDPSSYVVAFNISGIGTKSYRAPLAEVMLVAKSRIVGFDNLEIVFSGRASPVIERNKTVAKLLGLKTDFQRSNSAGVQEYSKDNTVRASGQMIRI